MEITNRVHAIYDRDGRLRSLSHVDEPYTHKEAGTPQALAARYVRDAAPLYTIEARYLDRLGERNVGQLTDDPVELHFDGEKLAPDRHVVTYVQTVYGLPVWKSGVAVTVCPEPLGVISSRSSLHREVQVANRDLSDADWLPGAFDVSRFDKMLASNNLRGAKAEITRTRLLVYRYDPERRYTDHPRSDDEREVFPHPKLPAVSRKIRPGADYIVTEVLWNVLLPELGRVNARMFIEPRTGSVLYARLLVATATGSVYEKDPVTAGNPAITPTSSTSDLNLNRTTATLEGIPTPSPGDPYELSGTYVYLGEDSDPVAPAPTEMSGNFVYDVDTNNFAAVNAYYHSDYVFRLIAGMGINMVTYFDGTSFPVLVDHRATIGSTCTGGNCVNASAPGNATGNGSDGFRFALAASGTTVGMAVSRRVTLHEFGHAVLWDNLHEFHFPFAHSCGDSMAAILCDPDSQAADRFETFPWVEISDRRHDRDPAAGWGWGGSQDNGGYDSEQILSTTLFRAYRMTGGDAAGLSQREFAARYLIYVLLSAVGGLDHLAPPSVEEFVEELIIADKSHSGFEGQPGGGTNHKVIRWSFEKQDLYGGDAPDVDVYIDDGRGGEYEPFLHNFWNTTDIWNRASPDGGTTHQTPIVGSTNYCYVRIKNRGTQTAENIVVKGYHCIPGAGLVWPDDWQAMTTPQLSAPNLVSGSSTVVGPFEWTPTVVGHECLLMSVSAVGATASTTDLSNADTVTGSIPHWRLVPFDNNIAQRNVSPVVALLPWFPERLRELWFWVRNPYEHAVEVELAAHLPTFLERRGWKPRFESQGGSRFKLGPCDSRKVFLGLEAGEKYSPDEVKRGGAIEVEALIDGILVGGMTFNLTTEEAEQVGPKVPRELDPRWARALLEGLGLRKRRIGPLKIRALTLEIDLDKLEEDGD